MKVAIIDDVAAHYRLLLWQILSKNSDPEYTFFAPEKDLNGINPIDPKYSKTPIAEGGLRWYYLKNVLINKMIIWQRGVFNVGLKGNFDAFILPGEIQILSNWLVLLIAKLRGKKIISWGHGLYGNEGFVKRKLRLLFYNLVDLNCLYNKRAKDILLQFGVPENKIEVVYNSLNFDSHIQMRSNQVNTEIRKKYFPKYPNLPILIFIGRITEEKKIEQLIQAIFSLSQNNQNLNCILVGNGPSKNKILDLVNELNLSDHVFFYGASYDDFENGELLNISDCCVSPGNVGLTAILSMAFGTPVISHNTLEYQGPEVSAIEEGITGELFEQDNVESLALKIIEVVLRKGKDYYRNNCINMIDTYYNPYIQKDIFNRALTRLIKE